MSSFENKIIRKVFYMKKLLSISSLVLFVMTVFSFFNPILFTRASDAHMMFLVISLVVSALLAIFNIKSIFSIITLFLILISLTLVLLFTLGTTWY